MPTFLFRFTLLSQATFGRGDGVAGLVDTEIEHDERGLPYLHGRGVKGLFTAQCGDLLGALKTAAAHDKFEATANTLFGTAGSDLEADGLLHFGTARLPQNLRDAIADTDVKELPRADVIGALTQIRRQTMINATTGAAKKNTLRALRVLMHDLVFEAEVTSARPLGETELALLAACVKAIRRVGSQRARGLGLVRAELFDAERNDLATRGMKIFQAEVLA